jgi:hypothetical protein
VRGETQRRCAPVRARDSDAAPESAVGRKRDQQEEPVPHVSSAGGVVGVGVGFALEEFGDEMIDAGKRLNEINPKMTR